MPGFGFGPGFSRRAQFPFGLTMNSALAPGENWDGTAASGFASVPADPQRTTAKPVCQMLDVPRQTITGGQAIGVFAAANNAGSLLNNLGMSHVHFHCEGNSVRVDKPSFRTFTRFDGSSYSLLGWWVTLAKPALTSGLAEIYVEAVPADPAMQSRVIGPFPFVMSDQQFDYDVTVAASGSGDHTTMASAFGFLRSQGAQHPRITVIEPGTYDLGGGGSHSGDGFCTIEAVAPVTFAQSAPSLNFDFTRMRPQYDRLRFKGSNITLDFVETLEFYSESTARHHWCDGCHVIQSRGRDDLWRGRPRNIIPALFRGGAYFTDCDIRDVNDWGDKTPLARGNVTTSTWADALQDAQCAIANVVIDHSSYPYYQNVDALSVQYTGSAATATVTLNGGNSNNRTLRLYEGDVETATFSIQNSEQAYRSNTNYTVQNVVDWINGRPGWAATLIDNSRFASALTFPGSSNGAGFIKLDAKSTALTLPTHFDIHSDLYQLPNLGSPRENVVFALNRGYQIDAQNTLISGTGGLNDSMFVGNAFFNNLGTPDEALSSQLNSNHSHVVFSHNSMPTQRILLRQDSTYDGDSFCLVANNVSRDLTVSGGGEVDADILVVGNHVSHTGTAPINSIDTTIGGTESDLFADAVNGDFTPAGALLDNLKPPVFSNDLNGTLRAGATPVGAVI